MSPFYESLSAAFEQDTLDHLHAFYEYSPLQVIACLQQDLRIVGECLAGKMQSRY